MKYGCFNSNCKYSIGKYFCDMNKVHADAADAIEALNRLVDLNTERCEGLRKQLREAQEQYEKHLNELEKELAKQLPKRGEWNNHEVACLLAEMFGDDCACNLNGIDEWLPQYCEFAETCCPNPVGVACWEQFLKHRAKMEVQDADT